MDVLIFQVSSFTIYCINASIFHVSSFTNYYMNALVIKASPLYILKQMPRVSICFRFSSLCLWKKKQSFEQQNLQSVHITVHGPSVFPVTTPFYCKLYLKTILQNHRFMGSRQLQIYERSRVTEATGEQRVKSFLSNQNF